MSVAIENTPTTRVMEGMVGVGFMPAGLLLGTIESPRPLPASIDYSVAGARLPIVAESLCAALELRPGQQVLDIGAGNGNIALSAGRRGCQVSCIAPSTSSRYMAAQLQRTRECVVAERLAVDFWRREATALRFQDARFDVVSSSFFAMFDPDQEQVASEMLRVCRSGGKIGLAIWTPDSFIGQLFRTIGKYVHVPAGDDSPFLWGTEERLIELFGSQSETIDINPRTFVFRYDTPRQWLDQWRSIYEPLHNAFERIGAKAKDELAVDLMALIDRCNTAANGTVALPGNYLEVVVSKRALGHGRSFAGDYRKVAI
jgi:SAM-dependent methyltransferase